MAGTGGCPYSAINRWDYLRYGRLTSGETIVAANPPAGYLNPETYASLDRFTVTFDQPNNVYVNDVTIEVAANQYRDRQGAGLATGDTSDDQHPALALGVPIVMATRRQDNGPPETVEIVLDRPLAIGQTMRFTFNTGAATPQVVEYTLAFDPHPVIPTTTTWGLVIFSLLLLIAAKVFLRVPTGTLRQ